MSARDKIVPHLIEGETILWAGQPNSPLVSRIGSAFLRVLGSGFLIVAILSFIDNLSGDWAMKSIFIIFGLFSLLIPDLITRSRRGTYYAVTNGRLISLFDGKSANILGLFHLPASFKFVELPINTVRDIVIEEYSRMWGVGVIFTDDSYFFPPPYIIENSDGDKQHVGAVYLLGSRSSRPYGYLFDSWDKNNVFCFGLLTKKDAEKIIQLIRGQ